MKPILILLTLCAATPAFADFTGRWKGTAVVTTRSGATIECDEIILNIRQLPDKFEFGTFRYACGAYGFNFTPPQLRIENGSVFWKDGSVGSVTPTTANLLFILANNGRARYTVSLTSPGEMNYLDEQIDFIPSTGEERITAIRARLVRIPTLPALAAALGPGQTFDSAGK